MGLSAPACVHICVDMQRLFAEPTEWQMPWLEKVLPTTCAKSPASATPSDIITKLARTGTHPSLDKMRADIPEGLLDMLAIPGLRPEQVIKLYKELGVSTLDELEAAAKEDRIKDVKGLGAALQRKILQGSRSRATRKARGTCTARKS
jgi:hypothetical protein